MKISVIGRGNVGGGLADLWEAAGHGVARIGREGGSVADADAVVLAVPGNARAQALENLQGLVGKAAIDATNLVGAGPPAGFPSNAEFVKSKTGGPTAKAFNINSATLYRQLAAARARPGNLWRGDAEAREVVERLSSDAGYEAICAGPLANAAMQEGFIGFVFAISQAGLGPFVYRMAPPDRL